MKTSSEFLRLAEPIETEGSRFGSPSVVEIASSRLRAADTVGSSPADLFDAFAYELGPAAEATGEFEAIALPGERLDRELREGDLLLRRGDGDAAYVSVLVQPRAHDLD